MAQTCPPQAQDVFESIPLGTEFSPLHPCYNSPPRALQELSIEDVTNRSRLKSDVGRLYAKSSRAPQVTSRGTRRRAAIEPETFEPLDAVQEETSSFLELDNAAVAAATGPSHPTLPSVASRENYPLASHPLVCAEPKSSTDEFLKHLAGQFEWLITCAQPACSTNGRASSGEGDAARSKGARVYGCNLLSRRQSSPSKATTTRSLSADTYTLIATPIESDAFALKSLETATPRSGLDMMAMAQPPSYESCQTTPLKVPELVEVVEQSVSPALTLASERSSSFAGESSRAGSFSVPRIEDSLEELDKLEEELEAIKAVTLSRRVQSPDDGKTTEDHESVPEKKKATSTKRASFVGQAATVRVKSSKKAQTSVRRSASLIFREKIRDEAECSPKNSVRVSRIKSVNSQSTTPGRTIKSTKPPTIPNFELPGEAVARRLKEQREARKAQQAEAQIAYVAPPRPRSSKPLTKPTFELPGEAISRRKREEREARLKAQEEEQRRKREFKARPVRVSVTPAAPPRDTISSRARQGKPLEDEAAKQADSSKSKRSSLDVTRAGSISNRSPQARGRLATIPSQEDLSRATSTSTGSISGKRSTLSVEDAQLLKLRGKEIFHRDNTRFKEDREREKREREMTARLAREQAAERSRAASREWAEKKRRKEQALKEAMRKEISG